MTGDAIRQAVARLLEEALPANPEIIVRRNKGRDGSQWEVIVDTGGGAVAEEFQTLDSAHATQDEAEDRAHELRYLLLADSAMAAHAAALDVAGYVIAPREPSDAMCDAATLSTSAFLNIQARGVELRRLKHAIRWRAMIKAAEAA